ncbi:hypothetical protein N7512_010560 [Penicillium capsulatum]|nr:hypothetical protein N7512_010560 [Penicillium capsulatum]
MTTALCVKPRQEEHFARTNMDARTARPVLGAPVRYDRVQMPQRRWINHVGVDWLGDGFPHDDPARTESQPGLRDFYWNCLARHSHAHFFGGSANLSVQGL